MYPLPMAMRRQIFARAQSAFVAGCCAAIIGLVGLAQLPLGGAPAAPPAGSISLKVSGARFERVAGHHFWIFLARRLCFAEGPAEMLSGCARAYDEAAPGDGRQGANTPPAASNLRVISLVLADGRSLHAQVIDTADIPTLHGQIVAASLTTPLPAHVWSR